MVFAGAEHCLAVPGLLQLVRQPGHLQPHFQGLPRRVPRHLFVDHTTWLQHSWRQNLWRQHSWRQRLWPTVSRCWSSALAESAWCGAAGWRNTTAAEAAAAWRRCWFVWLLGQSPSGGLSRHQATTRQRSPIDWRLLRAAVDRDCSL